MTPFKKYLLFSLIFALLNTALILIFFIDRFDNSDTEQYVATIKYITSGEYDDMVDDGINHRILKPLPLLVGSFLSPILSPENTLVAQNLVFYFLSIYIIFLIVNHLYHNARQAFYGTILFGTGYSMLAYGLAPLVDLSGWFFYFLIIWLSIKLLGDPNLKKSLLIGLISGLGMLFKESVAAAPIFFVSLIFIAAPFKFKDKFKYIFYFSIGFLVPVLLNNLLFYYLHSYTLLDWYREISAANPRQGFYAYSFLRIIIEIGRAFFLGWLFIISGALRELKEKNIERIKILYALIPSSLSFLIWPYPHNRIAYIAVPLLFLLGSFGILREDDNRRIRILKEISLLLIYICVNYFFLDFLLRYGNFLTNSLNL